MRMSGQGLFAFAGSDQDRGRTDCQCSVDVTLRITDERNVAQTDLVFPGKLFKQSRFWFAASAMIGRAVRANIYCCDSASFLCDQGMHFGMNLFKCRTIEQAPGDAGLIGDHDHFVAVSVQ